MTNDRNRNYSSGLDFGFKISKISSSFLQNEFRGGIGYAHISKLEAQFIGLLEVSIIIHDEINCDQLCDIGDVEPPGAVC